VTEAGYRGMAERLCRVADQVAEGRLVALLEGGYDLGALSRSLVEVLEVLDRRGEPASEDNHADDDARPSPEGEAAIARTLIAHRDQPWAGAGSAAASRQRA
jgi:acetoin utilization deacetylase AcuC-like enzyme